MRSISAEEIINIHYELVSMFKDQEDPISPSGVKDYNLLASAAARPDTSLNKIEKYKSIESKAAALFHSLIKNHAFHNGNKRTALASVIVYLDRNKIRIEAEDDDIFNFVLMVARKERYFDGSSDKVVSEIEGWLNINTRTGKYNPSAMTVNDFLKKVVAAGATHRKAGDGRVLITGPNKYTLGISGSTTKLTGQVVKRYLQNLGLSVSQAGIYLDEIQDGINPQQQIIRKFRNVLKRLAGV